MAEGKKCRPRRRVHHQVARLFIAGADFLSASHYLLVQGSYKQEGRPGDSAVI